MALPFDVANFNLVNFAEAYNDLFDSDPKDVTINVKDADGNITTKTVANRGKFKQQLWDDVGGAFGQFNKIVYIDQVNGSDLNPGTNTEPFKTVKQAVDSVPMGGAAVIYLTAGEHVIDRNIEVLSKNIYLRNWNTDKPTLRFTTKVIGTLNYINRFVLGGSVNVSASNVDFTVDEKADLSYGWNSNAKAAFTSHGSFAETASLYFYNSAITLNCTDGNFARLGNSVTGGFNLVSASYSTLTLNSNYFIDIVKPMAIYYTANTVDDSNYLLSGIVKDTNGVPRNVISDLIL